MREVLRRVTLRAVSPRPERPKIRHVTVVPARGCRVMVAERLAPAPRSEPGELEQVGGRTAEVV